MRGPSKREGELGPIGDRIVFENAYLRVWSIKLDPGERQTWHQHRLPYLIVPMTEGRNVMYYEDGREKETNETTGEVLWREPGIPHELVNISDWQYRNVLIEIKAVPGAAS
jgi:beta-alanine degradation protein BauB